MKEFPSPESSSFYQQFLPKTATRATPLILLTDDDRVTRIQVRRFLEREKYQVVEAADGTEGLDAFKRLKPDMVMVDAMMPTVNGFEFCTQLQNLPEAIYTPVLMITGLDDEKSVDRAFASGATDYVTKPIHWAVLRQRVRRLIQQAQLLRHLEAANKLFQQLSLVDELTQLGNRRHFDMRLDQEWRRMTREKLPLSLILCDIDFFKKYNDTHGHLKGDSCLRQVARRISAVAKRPADLAARYGGEEFAVILPNTTRESALLLAEKIRLGLQTMKLAHPDSAVSPWVTLSVGVSSTLPHQSAKRSALDLLAAADSALYQAKAAGRDRVAFCEMSAITPISGDRKALTLLSDP